MKRRILTSLIMCLSIYAIATNMSLYNSADSRDDLLIEGKSWWYTQHSPSLNQDLEFQLFAGEQKDIDNVTWNTLKKGISCIVDKNGAQNYDTDTLLLAYMRQEGEKVYALVDQECKLREFFENEMINPTPINYLFFYKEACIYVSEMINKEWNFGNEEAMAPMKISAIENFENSGIDYQKYISEPQETDESYILPIPLDNFTYVKDIGILSDCESDHELLFSPIGIPISSYARWGAVRLRYVTDPEMNVIYERKPGFKLWEEYAGQNDIMLPVDSGACEYYTLQGIKIEKPTAGSLVIEKKNGKVRKYIYK